MSLITLYFYFCVQYSKLTTKNLVSIHHHTVGALYLFCPPHPHFPSGSSCSFLCIYKFLFGLFIYFVILCLFLNSMYE